jgi:hypothetical protein
MSPDHIADFGNTNTPVPDLSIRLVFDDLSGWAMFDARFIVGGTVRDTPVPLTIVGSQGRRATFPVGTTIIRDELESLPEIVRRLWPAMEVPPGLLAHVIREARESDLITGQTPETYSPLGDIRPDSVGRWVATDGLADAHPDAVDPPSARVRMNRFTRGGSPLIEFIIDGEVVSALIFSTDAMVIPVPADIDTIDLIDQPSFADNTVELLTEVMPGVDIDELVLWRLYTGDNSCVRDAIGQAVDGVHRLSLRAANRTGVLVARTVKIAARVVNRDHGDPFAGRRLRTAEMRERDVANSSPQLKNVTGRKPEAVVAVHGTMSTGLALAAAVRASTTPLPLITRFEHDTWLPIGTNAETLADLVTEHVSANVLFVAHSRGGLVARHAAEILRGRTPNLTIEVLTLGTPFLGTPLADAASVGFRGVQALMGGLRWAGIPVVDTLTRLVGLAIKSHPPQGITDMSPRPGYLSGFILHPPTSTTTFAGQADESGPDSCGLAFLQGCTAEMMNEEPSDLVVSVKSATGGVTKPMIVECDHFSYLEQPRVSTTIEECLARFPHIHSAMLRRRLRETRHRPFS